MKDNEKEGDGEMEKVIKLTVMITESQAEELSLCQQETGANCSEIMRFALTHSIPVARSFPSLIHIVPTIPNRIHGKATR